MDKKNFSFDYAVFSQQELSERQRELVERVKTAASGAYAPYSHFHVGAGVLFSDGEIVTSTNQESEVYPSGICAERSLLYFVQSNYSDRLIEAMAVTAPPCGACRQVIVDSEKRNGKDMAIIIIESERYLYIDTAKNLLPITFTLDR